ncbi:MAG: translational GTPase TypA, partial [Oscillospiraceae bacterium]
SRQIRDRLYKELLKDVSLHVEDTVGADSYRVLGRGEMHLSILIETMRREGYEFQVSAPKVLFKYEDGKQLEPYEEFVVDVPEEYMGSVMEKMGYRKGELTSMNRKGSRMELKFIVPSRGLFGYRSEFLTDTHGEGIQSSIFNSYGEYKGEISNRKTGSLIAFETGEAVAYGIFGAQDRGMMFIDPGDKVYAGMVVGSNPKGEDITVNVCK